MIPVGKRTKCHQIEKGLLRVLARHVQICFQMAFQKGVFSSGRQEAVTLLAEELIKNVVPALWIDNIHPEETKSVDPATDRTATKPRIRIKHQSTADGPSQKKRLDRLKSCEDDEEKKYPVGDG